MLLTLDGELQKLIRLIEGPQTFPPGLGDSTSDTPSTQASGVGKPLYSLALRTVSP
jgi:hypothetical protein